MIFILIIIAFNIVLYFPTLFLGYVMDDTNQIANKKTNGWGKAAWGVGSSWREVFKIISQRLYGCGTFYNSKWSEKVNTVIDHSFTLILWTTLCVMIYFAFGHNNISFATALLVSCNPMMNQLSIWLNGRRYVMCAVLLMGFMIAGPVWGMPLYFMSALFQTTILFAPVLFVMKAPWVILAVGLLAIIMMDWIKSKIKNRAAMIPSKDMKEWRPRRPVIVVKVFGFYFFKMIWTDRVQMVYPFLQMFGRSKEGNENSYSCNGDFIKGVCALLCCAGIIYFSFQGVGSMGSATLAPMAVFMVLSLLQWSAIISVTQLIADRYAGVATIFMCFFMAYFLLTYLPLWAAVGVIAVMIGHYVTVTRGCFFMYRDIDAWYDYHVHDDFSNLVIMNLHIGILLSKKRIWQAQAMLENGLSYYPKDYALNYLGYITSMIIGAPPLAQKYLDVCKENIYCDEEEMRAGELADAQLGVRAMMGEKNLVVPPHMQMKKGNI